MRTFTRSELARHQERYPDHRPSHSSSPGREQPDFASARVAAAGIRLTVSHEVGASEPGSAPFDSCKFASTDGHGSAVFLVLFPGRDEVMPRCEDVGSRRCIGGLK